MPQQAPAHTLLQGHTRLINASEGMCLEVLSGCLWLTRPGDGIDHFLVAGSTLELHENLVLIQSDSAPSIRQGKISQYRLTPLRATHIAATSFGGFKQLLWGSIHQSC